jgi:hypothetical protein
MHRIQFRKHSRQIRIMHRRQIRIYTGDKSEYTGDKLERTGDNITGVAS